MILYSSSKNEFIKDVNNNKITEILNNIIKETMYRSTSEAEQNSWKNSLEYMSSILINSNLPQECTIILEYNLPISSSRIDLMISGYDKNNIEKLLIFELKQWSKVNLVNNSDILLETFVGKGLKKVVHPAYQVLTYCDILNDYNQYIQDNNIIIIPCVILHNYIKDDIFNSNIDSNIINKVEVFFKDDSQKLINFINNSFIKGDNGIIINNIDKSNFYPSKKLQDGIKELMKGNECFKLIDNQVIVLEELLNNINNTEKTVSIVNGSPGTGKSVLAINLLTKLIIKGKMAQYVSRNTAPRTVYSYELKGTMNRNNIDNLFKTSGSYTSVSKETFDCLIVDESHCLTEKSGLFNNYGENQIKEIIESSKHAIFFIDEKQKVHLNDIGTIKEIEKWSNILDRKLCKYSLESQFRCNGSNDYLSFVDYLLDYNNNFNGSIDRYEFKVCDSPEELRNLITLKNQKFKSRILAGYCWNWDKKEIDNSSFYDIKIDNFGISWNLGSKQTYAIDDSINEAGCIHSVQGLEFDYVGVIIGPDIFYKDNKVMTDFHKHASTDPSFKGIKKLEKEDKNYANKVADILIKNAYRVLMTRGIKGCYIFCVDKQLNDYYKQIVEKI